MRNGNECRNLLGGLNRKEKEIVAANQKDLLISQELNSAEARMDGLPENQDANIFLQFHAIIYIFMLREIHI